MATILRFETCTFDPASGELTVNGQQTRLELKPARVLSLLASRAGQVVTREELQRDLWPADTYVDAEQGINYCIRRVRAALDDSAAQPRFVETLPKRGYRFLPQVETVTRAQPLSSASRRPNGRLFIALAGGALLVALAANTLLSGSRPAPPPTIAVTLFDNETARPELDRVAQVFTDVLVERLARSSGRWSVIGNAAILRTKRPFLNLERIASSLPADYFVLGQLEPGPHGVIVLTHLIRARDQRHLWAGRVEGSADDARLPEQVADRVTAAGLRLLGSRP